MRRRSPTTQRSATAAILEGLAFRFPWRAYQERVLAAAERHFGDGRLHIVAAPGAGKTSLGLEVFRRLGKPCLVLSPTRTIRDQWITRLADFLPEGTDPLQLPWVSHDLDAPAVMTSITYQALHVQYREDLETQEDADGERAAPEQNELKKALARIRKAGIGTLILDEAHHLHAEWWKALTEITDHLQNLHVVCLTATPPYDVVGKEWRRYQDLCGPIDEEISVPELVRAGNLCPHQDYVYLVGLTQRNREKVVSYEESVTDVLNTLTQSAEFRAAVLDHPWLREGGFDAAAALDGVTLLVSLLVFRKNQGFPLPLHCLTTLDTSLDDIPELNRYWWSVLVHGFLFDESFVLSETQEEYQKKIAKLLRARGLLERRDLCLNDARSLQHSLATTEEKIEACVDICRIEREIRGRRLRQVILTDFIRDEEGLDFLSSEGGLGAWPVFRAVLRDTPHEARPYVALLTGRAVMVHAALIEPLRGRVPDAVYAPVPNVEDLFQVSGQTAALAVALTKFMQMGHLRVLVGTKALLGEGWDCPVLNSIVLATGAGSFVMTNQMRGRVIRTDSTAPEKTASVWHIAAVERDFASGLQDYVTLAQRFNTFVGLHHSDPVIEGGIERLGLPEGSGLTAGLAFSLGLSVMNEAMEERCQEDLTNLPGRWRTAIERGVEHAVVPAIETGSPPSFRKVYFKNTLPWLAVGLLFSVGAQMIDVIRGLVETVLGGQRGPSSLFLISAVLGLGLVASLPSMFRTVRGLLRHLPVDGSIRQIGLALCDALCEAGIVTTDRRELKVLTNNHLGQWSVFLTGADYYEQCVFADSLNEILGPIENPRYLITRRAGHRMDYHAVPTVLGASRERAEVFYGHWRKRVAKGELIYTRNPAGRAVLLKARVRAFSSRFVRESRRLSRWQ